nr:hypothetical protein [Tanacetum cinerariifolium]
MDQQYPTVAKIPILDTGKFEQWQFWIQQYLQHEHYALWEVIEFGDSYEVPESTTTTDTTSGETGKKSGRTVTLTTEVMQKKKNDVKARTTLLLSLPDEHQLQFSKYKTARELWAAILKTFGGNEATKKTKKNLLKQQYGNFKAEGSETLEQTFNRLQMIVGQLQFMDVDVEQDDLNQKFLTSLAPKWLMHTIVWRNMSYLDTMSLDDLYNHLKVYESEVQKKSEPNSHNVAFFSSAKHSSRNEYGNTACVPTASTNVPTASASVATISQDTACAYIASQSSGSQIKFEDINQIDEDDMEEIDIKWNMALLSIRDDKFWKKTGKKISIQGSDMAGFDKSKGECFNCHKMGHSVRECRAPRSQDRGRRDNYRQGSKAKEQAPKALMAIDGKIETLKQEKEGVDGKLTGLLTASKNLDNLIESQRSDKSKDRLGYSVVPPPPAQLYSYPKKELSWTGLPEFADDTVTDYSRPSPTVESTSGDDQNRNPSVSKTVASPITPKPFIKKLPAGSTKCSTKKNDVKAMTTLLLSLPDEHQLRFSKYKTARELWVAILKTFGGNEATKKRKKNLLKQQYGNFKAEGTETLEQTFNRLQVIVSQLQFRDVEIEKDDLNQKFLTSLAPEWLMHTIDMAFISSSKNNNNEDGNIVCVTTATTAFPTGSVNVATISQDTASAFIASQSNGSQIKFEDINQIDEDDMEEMDIKWNMVLLSMGVDKF